MATINNVIDWVYDTALKRTDISTLVSVEAIKVYRTLCNKIPFEELQAGPETIACVAGTQTYSLAGLANPLAGIVSIKIEYSASSAIRLKRDHVRSYDNMPTPANGKPIRYARWGTGIELWPPPNAAYNLKIRYWQKAQTVIAGGTTMLIPEEWVELVHWETLYRVLTVLNQEARAMSLIMPAQMPRMATSKKVHMADMGIIPRLWNELLTTISQKENIDEEFSINPLQRMYTNG